MKRTTFNEENCWDLVLCGQDLICVGIIWKDADNADISISCYHAGTGTEKWSFQLDLGPRESALVLHLSSDRKFLYLGGFQAVKTGTLLKGKINKSLLICLDLEKLLAGLKEKAVLWTQTWGERGHGHHEVDGIYQVGKALYVSHWDASAFFYRVRAVIKKFTLDPKGNKAPELQWSRTFGEANRVTTSSNSPFVNGGLFERQSVLLALQIL